MYTGFKSKNLLSVGADAKTVKGEALGFLTGILYLAPAKSSGYQMCPMASIAQCEASCLNTAGRGQQRGVQLARVSKTLWLMKERESFMQLLVKNIVALQRKADKLGLIAKVRLNGTSDIRWERVEFTDVDGKYYVNIMERFPNVSFYDYTKDANRDDLPTNYDLTFSYSGVEAYQPFVNKAVAKGMRMAVVFRHAVDIPKMFMGIPVLSGDNSDVRDLDPNGVIIGLYAKGKAVHDQSGFVV